MGTQALDLASQQIPIEASDNSNKPLAYPQRDRGSAGSLQRALLNILEDLTEEQNNFEAAQRAVLNILEDSDVEKAHLHGAQRAVLNILEDSDAEKASLREAQRAVLNILEDFDFEKTKVEMINQELQAEIEGRHRAQKEIEDLNQNLERRVMERTAELTSINKELEAFSYSVSHDLRAPLRAINGFCRILTKDHAERLDSEGTTLLMRVTAASQRMDQLIEGLLSLSRMARSEVHRTTVDITAMAQAIALDLQKANPAAQVDFVISPGLVGNADASLLRTVLENLLGNAWKFTSKHPKARVEVGVLEHQGETAYFVRDDGAGFDMAYANKLFGTFQRLHTPAEFEGTGIGLANVQRIILRHGGRVWAEGEVEKGATFFFTLPVESEVIV